MVEGMKFRLWNFEGYLQDVVSVCLPEGFVCRVSDGQHKLQIILEGALTAAASGSDITPLGNQAPPLLRWKKTRHQAVRKTSYDKCAAM